MKKAKPQDIVYQYVKNQFIGKSMFPGNRIIEDDIIRETGTSPTCFQEITQQSGCDVAARFISALEAAVTRSRPD